MSEWREWRVGDLVRRGALIISDGYRVRNEELGPTGIPFVRGGDIGDGWINTDTKDHVRPEYVDRVRTKLTQAGDAAFITKGTVGRAGWLRPHQPPVVFAPQVAYWRVVDRELLDPRFIFYLIRSNEFAAALDADKTHGAMVADYVSISQQHDFRFRLPRVETQRAVAHVLGTLDDKVELNRRTSETLESMARALFNSWFVDFDPVRAKAEGHDPSLPKAIADLFPSRLVHSELGGIPEGWRAERLEGLVETLKGRSYRSADLIESDTALVTLKSFRRGGGYRPDGLKSYRGPYKPEQVVEPGEVVVACTDVTQAAEVIGRPAIVRGSTRYRTLVASLDTLILRPRGSNLRCAFLYFLCGTDAFKEHTYAHATGTTVLHLMKEAVPSFVFVQPPAKLIDRFESLAGASMARVESLAQETDTLATLRDTLLPKLISGELRVRDAERFATRN